MKQRKLAEIEESEVALSYRIPMRVTEIRHYIGCSGHPYYPLCPRCSAAVNCEYQSYCDQCGQALDWKQLSKATVIPFPSK